MGLPEQTAQQLRTILAAIDEGELVATPRQRAYLLGAMEALASMPAEQMSTGAADMSTETER